MQTDTSTTTTDTVTYVIGVTGGIASGKSTCCRRCSDLGLHVINADNLGHEAYTVGSACYYKVVQQFGSEVLQPERKEIDRSRLGQLVFGSPREMKKLTDVVWPEIRRLATQKLEALKTDLLAGNNDMNKVSLCCEEMTDIENKCRNELGCKIILLEAAVLIEAEWTDMIDALIVMEIPREVAVERLITRNNSSSDAANKKIDFQMSCGQRKEALERCGRSVEFVDASCTKEEMTARFCSSLLELVNVLNINRKGASCEA